MPAVTGADSRVRSTDVHGQIRIEENWGDALCVGPATIVVTSFKLEAEPEPDRARGQTARLQDLPRSVGSDELKSPREALEGPPQAPNRFAQKRGSAADNQRSAERMRTAQVLGEGAIPMDLEYDPATRRFAARVLRELADMLRRRRGGERLHRALARVRTRSTERRLATDRGRRWSDMIRHAQSGRGNISLPSTWLAMLRGSGWVPGPLVLASRFSAKPWSARSWSSHAISYFTPAHHDRVTTERNGAPSRVPFSFRDWGTAKRRQRQIWLYA